MRVCLEKMRRKSNHQNQAKTLVSCESMPHSLLIYKIYLHPDTSLSLQRHGWVETFRVEAVKYFVNFNCANTIFLTRAHLLEISDGEMVIRTQVTCITHSGIHQMDALFPSYPKKCLATSTIFRRDVGP